MQRLVTIPLRAVGRPGEVLWKGGWPIAIQRPLSSFLNGFEIVVEALFTNEPVACCGEGKPKSGSVAFHVVPSRTWPRSPQARHRRGRQPAAYAAGHAGDACRHRSR